MSRALEDAHIQYSGVDEVHLLGGSTNLVSVQETLCETFGADKINRGINLGTTVAIGAAAYAYAASGSVENMRLTELQVLDIVPRSLRVLLNGINMLPFL